MAEQKYKNNEGELSTWMRIDYNNVSLRGSNKGGPKMEDVRVRETLDLHSGEVKS